MAIADDGSAPAPIVAAEDPSDPTGLPAAAENIELVGELNPQHFGGVRIGEIADLAVHKGYAYLNSWDAAECDRGGTYVVDIKDPTQPKEVAYIPPIQPFYHGEGAHVISLDTQAFTGDVLAVNDETWGSNVGNDCGPDDVLRGGFDLYDVTDPTNPKVLVQGAGDRDNGTPDDPSDDNALGNSYHSVFVWQAGPRAFLVASDNFEFEDVDIFDITDPTAPEQVADIELAALFPQILEGEKANGNAIFNHDMIVKQIGGRYIMSVSNWDSGYVQIDVTDPANPTYVIDTTFGADPFRPSLFAEGNAHQSEFSADNQFLLAADEDFAPFRSVLTGATTGKTRSAIEAGDNPNRIANLPDGEMDGPTVWAGNGCEGAAFDTVDPADPEFPAAPPDDGDPNTDRIALVERGGPIITQTGAACGFAQKFDNAAAAGFDGIVIFNQVRPDDGQVNMLTNDGTPALIPGVQMRRVDALGPEGAIDSGTVAGAFGTAGPNVTVGSVFDGWGYAHLYDAVTGEELDAFAVPESQDSRFASGFGTLSIHEFATDPTEPVAYSAYYGAGMRTFRFSRADGLVPTGKWIDDDGNGSNFWGVEVFTGADGERYFAGSDRDFGLQIFRYTGPAAAKRPTCAPASATTAHKTAVTVPLSCTDANGNPLTMRIVDGPSNGTTSALSTSSVTYTPTGSFFGQDQFTVAAFDGAASSAPATVTIRVLPPSDYYNIPPGGEPDNYLHLGVRNYKRGRMGMRATVRAPGVFRATLQIRIKRKGQRVRRWVRLGSVERRFLNPVGGTFAVAIRPSEKKRALLRRFRERGDVRARVRARWAPDGGELRRLTVRKIIRGLD